MIPCEKRKYVRKIILSVCATTQSFVRQIVSWFPDLKELEFDRIIIIEPTSQPSMIHSGFTQGFFDSELFDNIDQISVTELSAYGSIDINKTNKKIIPKSSDHDQGCRVGESFCKCTVCSFCTTYGCPQHYPGGIYIQWGSYPDDEIPIRKIYPMVKIEKIKHCAKKVLSKDSYRSYESNKGSRNPKIRKRWIKYRR